MSFTFVIFTICANFDVACNWLSTSVKLDSAKNAVFSGYIRAKILLETGDYDGIIKQCSEEIEAPKAHGETVEISKGKSIGDWCSLNWVVVLLSIINLIASQLSVE